MDNKGGATILAVITVTITLVILTVLVVTLGTFIDVFIGVFQSEMCSTPRADLIPIMETSMQFFTMFYWLPPIFVVLIFVWLFKVLIMRSKYLREDENEW